MQPMEKCNRTMFSYFLVSGKNAGVFQEASKRPRKSGGGAKSCLFMSKSFAAFICGVGLQTKTLRASSVEKCRDALQT